MIKILIGLGLGLIPFFFVNGFDTRQPKMALALVLALILNLWVIYQGKLKAFKNKWLLFFLISLCASIYFMPRPSLLVFNIEISNFWVWECISQIAIFFMMLVSVASLDFTKDDLRLFFKIISYVGLVMSLYCILQYFKIDQFFYLMDRPDIAATPMPYVGGTMGQPTIVASFLAIIIPVVLYSKKWLIALLMIGVVILTKSQVAIGAMVISLLFYFGVKSKKTLILFFVSLLLLSSAGIIAYKEIPQTRKFINDSARFSHWEWIAKDIKSPFPDKSKKTYSLTGFGIGTFKWIYHIKHDNNWFQAHNEYLEILYNTGIIGFIFFILSILYLWKINLSYVEINDRYRISLLSSFLCILIIAGGNFIWQLGGHIYYVIFIAGLLHNTGGLNEESAN